MAFGISTARLATRSIPLQQQQVATWRKKQFSTSSIRQRSSPSPKQFMPKRPSQPSVRVQMTKEQEKARREGSLNIPDDFNVLPDTLIPSSGAKSWKYRWECVKAFFADRGTFYYMKLFELRGKNYDLNRKKLPTIGLEMYKRAWKAFALGDLKPVRQELCDGIAMSLQKRIDKRNIAEFSDWDVVEVRKLQLVTYKIAPLPVAPGSHGRKSYMMQAIIKIQNVERLQNMVRKQKGKAGNSNKTVMEEPIDEPMEAPGTHHLVLNKLINAGNEGHWKIWGFTNETTPEGWEETKQKSARVMEVVAAQRRAGNKRAPA